MKSTASDAYWRAARAQLTGLPGGGLNIAFEAVDRHAAAHGATVALRFLRKDGSAVEYTYARLASESNRFANALRALEIGAGEVVATVLGRCPELYVTALGTLKNRGVYCPLFSAFGPEPIRDRLRLGKARAVVTTEALHRKKIASIAGEVPSLRHVLHTGDELQALLARASESFTIPPTDPEDPALLHFTSGTTGRPKGALHVHQAVVAHHATGGLALDLRPGDRFWCTADPGWVTGTSYGIVAPLTRGVTMIVDEAEFDPDRWYRVIQDEKITVWYTAPTAIRMLMKAGAALARTYDLSSLRFIASVGEALNPQAVVWGEEAFGIPIHDNWWQTETGGIMIANVPGMTIRPGSMGKPLPGVDATLVRRRDDGTIDFVTQPGEEGEIALHRGWPSMFRAYLGEEERYRNCFAGDWYLTGDLARRDADGYFWFVGRSDDVIKSSGHLIGPFEVESALLDHAAVAEAAVIGKPDAMAGEIVKAFVALKPGFTASDALRDELLGFARKKLGAVVAPKEIAFLDTLPKTGSEKIMRRLLKARELGLPEGDISTTIQSPLPAARGEGQGEGLLRDMLRIRAMEEKCAELYTEEKIRGFLHLYIGEEAVAVGATRALTPDDAVVATYREHGHALLRGVSMRSIMAEMFGKAEGCSRGRGGSMHLFSAGHRFFGGNAIVGGGLPLAVGMALADRMRGLARVTACFFGDGAVAEGEFHESLNLAALWKLPVLFLCENNLYAMGTAVERALANTDVAKKAASYSIVSSSVDGMDVLAVEAAAREAADAIRRGEGPRLLELRTYRFRAHSMFDPERYREKSEVAKWKERDPIATFAALLLGRGDLSDAAYAAMQKDVEAEVADAVAFAEQGTWEPVAELTRFVYSDSSSVARSGT